MSIMSRSFCTLLALTVVGLCTSSSHATFVINTQPGYDLFWTGTDGAFSSNTSATVPNNPALASNGAIPFGSGALVFPHTVANINDGEYGNANSWISAPTATPFIGVDFNAGVININSFAFGRDNGLDAANGDSPNNGGHLMDRALGDYTIQRTTVASPGAGTTFTGNAATGWETIGSINYLSADDAVTGFAFTPWLRHEFGVTLGGAAVPASGLRILPSSDQIAIDELEVYTGPAFANPLTLIETGGTMSPDNIALSPGATAFAKDFLAVGPHNIPNLNDGLYGNTDSWIGATDPNFVGVDFNGSFLINQVAFGRDNGGEDQVFTDRTDGTYVVQYTTVADPSELTADSDWITLGALAYAPNDPDLTRWLRHLYEFDPVMATGLRIMVGPNGINNGIAIDELEVYATVAAAVPEPGSAMLLLAGLAGLAARRRRRMA